MQIKLQKSLMEVDPEVFQIIEKERARQRKGLELIASEVNFMTALFFSSSLSFVFAPIFSLTRTSPLGPYWRHWARSW